jgi:hypothetical protein
MVLRRGDGLRKETTVATTPRALPMMAMIGLICCGLLCTWAVYLISTSCGHGTLLELVQRALDYYVTVCHLCLFVVSVCRGCVASP